MSGRQPRLVANEAQVVATNSLHVLRVRPLMCASGRTLAVLASTSLTRLSAEIEGHALGGGLLKLEPTEAERLLVLSVLAVTNAALPIADELDALFRTRSQDAARERADQLLLMGALGLSEADCRCLRKAALLLESRRLTRSRSA